MPKTSKYVPHQGKSERERRQRQALDRVCKQAIKTAFAKVKEQETERALAVYNSVYQ